MFGESENQEEEILSDCVGGRKLNPDNERLAYKEVTKWSEGLY